VSVAAQMVEVSPELFRQYGWTLIDLPPVDWFVKGPRGGLYEATGARTRKKVEDGMGHLYVIDRSEGLRYLRPGSKRHAEAKAAT
jgi:hypothetical protein